MPQPDTLATRQGVAYVIAAHDVFRQQSQRTQCPEAQLLTLLALHTFNEDGYLAATTKQLHQVMRLSLPLLRGYVRELVTRGYVERVSFYRRGPRLLQLTSEGRSTAQSCQRALRKSAGRVLDR